MKRPMQGPPIDPVEYDGPAAPMSKAYVDSLIEDPAITDEQFKNITGFQSKQEYLDTPNYGESSADKAKEFIIPEEPGDRQKGFGFGKTPQGNISQFQYMNQGGLIGLPVVYQNKGKFNPAATMNVEGKLLGGGNASAIVDGKYVYPGDENYPEEEMKSIPGEKRMTSSEFLESQRPDMARSVQEDLDEILKTGPGRAGAPGELENILTGTQLGKTLEVPIVIEDPKVEAENLTSDTDIGGLNLEGTTTALPSAPVLSSNNLSDATVQNVTMPTSVPDIEGLKVEEIKNFKDPSQTALDDFNVQADAYSKLLAQLGSKDEMDRRRADAEEAKNRNLGLAMMKAFGDPLDPTLSPVQQLTARGKSLAEGAEPGMEKYREEIKEIEDLPLSVGAQRVELAKDRVITSDKAANRALEVLKMNKNIESSNVVTMLDLLKTNINLDISNRDHQLKAKEFNAQLALSKDKNQIDLYGIGMNYASASDANKLKYATHLKDLRDAGDMTTKEVSTIQKAVATKIFGGENVEIVYDEQSGDPKTINGIPVAENNELLNQYRSAVAAVTNQFGLNKKLYKYSGGQQGADPLQTMEGDINDIIEAIKGYEKNGRYNTELAPMRGSSDSNDKKIIDQFDLYRDKYPGVHIDVLTKRFMEIPEIDQYFTKLQQSRR